MYHYHTITAPYLRSTLRIGHTCFRRQAGCPSPKISVDIHDSYYGRRVGEYDTPAAAVGKVREVLAEALAECLGKARSEELVAEQETWAVYDRLYDQAAHAALVASRTAADVLRSAAGRALVRGLGGRSYSAETDGFARRPVIRQVDAVLAARARRVTARKTAEAARIAPSGRYAAVLERLRAERLEALRRETEEALLSAADYRTARNGHGHDVQFGAPGVSSDTGVDRTVYRRGAFKGWGATTSRHVYTVPLTWLVRVHRRGLAVVDGLLTLDAEPVPGYGPELYRAVWVEQGRGTALNAVRGHIARQDGTSYHAASARAALDGLARKLGQKPARRKGTLDLDRLARRHGQLPVTLADSLAAGNCRGGSRSWCHSAGIDPDGTATVAEVVAAYKLRPLPEVVSVLRRVVRTARNRRPVETALPTLPPSALEGEGRIVFDAEGGFHIEIEGN